jgi:hypothetical protein
MEATLGSLASAGPGELSVRTEAVAGARREWVRCATSWKGRLVLLGFLVAVAAPGIFRALHREAGSARTLAIGDQARALVKLYDLGVARNLYPCPASLVLSTVLLLYGLPLVMLLLAHDVFAPDVPSPFDGPAAAPGSGAGRVVGAVAGRWAFFGCGALILYAVVGAVEAVAGGPSTSTAVVLGWGASLFVSACLIAAAYTALCALVSASFPNRWWTFGVGFASLVGLGLLHAVLHARAPLWARPLPGALDGLLLSNRVALRLEGTIFAGLWCAVGLAGAVWALARRRRR